MKILVTAFLLLFTAQAYANDEASEVTKAVDIVKKWDNRETGKDLSSTSDFTLMNSRGQKRVRQTRRYLTYMNGKDGFEEKSIVFFDKPTDVKGTSMLNWSYTDLNKDDDQWLYLPALRKIKRIASSDKEKSFMGSDLTFDDMGDRKVEEDDHKLLPNEKLNGRTCFVIEMKPKDEKYMYSKKIKWIDAEEYIDYRTDFYDRKGKFLKKQEIEWQKVKNIWVIKKMTVKNDQTGHSTIIDIKEVKLNTGLKERTFSKRKMESGR